MHSPSYIFHHGDDHRGRRRTGTRSRCRSQSRTTDGEHYEPQRSAGTELTVGDVTGATCPDEEFGEELPPGARPWIEMLPHGDRAAVVGRFVFPHAIASAHAHDFAAERASRRVTSSNSLHRRDR